jgi:TolB-like protein/tetratricopeptide (TPR) repeat protein
LFVCYAHADAESVYADLVDLRGAGFNIWYDEGIPPGSTWRDEVALALSQSATVLYFASPESAASANCQQELNFALSRERRVLSVHLAQTELPPGLELSLADRQAIMRFEFAQPAYRDKLETTLRRMIGEVAPAPLPIIDAPLIEDPDRRSIAILPLANRSRDPDNEYLSDGITEELIAGLSALDDLNVKSFLAVTPYKSRSMTPAAIGRELGVESIVSGSLQQAGARIRISVALTRVEDGESLWSQHYDNDMDDLFSLQDDVARQVVEALRIELGDDHDQPLIDAGTNNVEAYRAYLLGRHEAWKSTPGGDAMAIVHLERAAALEPTWAECLRRLAEAYWIKDFRNLSGGDIPARENLRAVIGRLDALDPRKTLQRRFVYDSWLAGKDSDEGTAQLRRQVIERQDRYDDSYVADALGNFGFACRDVGLYACMIQFVARRSESAYVRAWGYAGLGQFDRAIQSCTTALDAEPEYHAALVDRCIWSVRTGQYERVREDLDVLAGVWGEHNFGSFNDHFWKGELDEARTCFEWLEARQRFAAAYKGVMALMLGEMDRALVHFETTAQQKGFFNGMVRAHCDVYLSDSDRTALWAEPRWHQVLAELNADDAARKRLIAELNELAPHTGISLDANGDLISA